VGGGLGGKKRMGMGFVGLGVFLGEHALSFLELDHFFDM